MKLDSCPRHLLQKFVELSDCTDEFDKTADAAAARLERLRGVVTQSQKTSYEDYERTKGEFEHLLSEVPKLQSLARAERAALTRCKGFV